MLNRIKKYILLTFLFSVTSSVFGQGRVDSLINELGWHSINIHCNYVLVLNHSDTVSNELVEIGGEATYALYNNLTTPNKTIAIHIILSRIYPSKDQTSNSLATKYIYKNCDDLIGWHYMYNGIAWEWFERQGDQITKSEMNKTVDFWNKKLNLKKDMQALNHEIVMDSITIADSINYPCNGK